MSAEEFRATYLAESKVTAEERWEKRTIRFSSAAAKKAKVPIQPFGAPRGTGTDGNAMQLSRGGVATAIVGIPNRYMHTPVEMVHLKDVEHASKLIAEWIANLKPNARFIP